MGNPNIISGKDEGPQKLASQKNKGTYKQLLLSKDTEQCQLLAECAAGSTAGCGEDSRMEGLNWEEPNVGVTTLWQCPYGLSDCFLISLLERSLTQNDPHPQYSWC